MHPQLTKVVACCWIVVQWPVLRLLNLDVFGFGRHMQSLEIPCSEALTRRSCLVRTLLGTDRNSAALQKWVLRVKSVILSTALGSHATFRFILCYPFTSLPVLCHPDEDSYLIWKTHFVDVSFWQQAPPPLRATLQLREGCQIENKLARVLLINGSRNAC